MKHLKPPFSICNVIGRPLLTRKVNTEVLWNPKVDLYPTKNYKLFHGHSNINKNFNLYAVLALTIQLNTPKENKQLKSLATTPLVTVRGGRGEKAINSLNFCYFRFFSIQHD